MGRERGRGVAREKLLIFHRIAPANASHWSEVGRVLDPPFARRWRVRDPPYCALTPPDIDGCMGGTHFPRRQNACFSRLGRTPTPSPVALPFFPGGGFCDRAGFLRPGRAGAGAAGDA